MRTKDQKKKNLTIGDVIDYKQKYGGYVVITTRNSYFVDSYEITEEDGLKWLFSPFALDVQGGQFIEVRLSLPHIVAIEKHV